jgi:hypothetical protein
MLRRPLTATILGLACLAAAAPPAPARSRAPFLSGVRCVPPHAPGCGARARSRVGGQVQLRGRRLYRGTRVTFRWSTGAIATTLQHSRSGWIARVPAGTRLGVAAVYVRDRAGRRSNARHVLVVAKPRPHPPAPAAPAPQGGPLPVAFQGDGMWIWELSKSEGGDLGAIADRAHATGISTVFVKSGDGTDDWPQFSPLLVSTLHANGLRVCAWQFVYGRSPVTEARVAAGAVTDGADCLVIDAETAYEGRYASAQRYIDALRAAVGESYPLGLTSYPYVDYHPGEPYSVFLGPGGAQANLPQVYWKAIGGGVAAVSAHTWMHNRIYGTPIAPLGQAYNGPSSADIQRFRQIWASYGADGLSWWSWQAASDATWTALADPDPPATAIADPGWPELQLKSKGDEVVWLQEHLASADPAVPVDGTFGSQTDRSLRAFQTARGLPPTGLTDTATWQALLALPVRAVDWTAKSSSTRARAAHVQRAEIRQLGRGSG